MTKRTLLTLSLASIAALSTGTAAVANAASRSTTKPTSEQREANYEQRLQTAVTKGKLTSAQETAILAEHNKLKAELTAAPTATAAELQAIRKQVFSEAEAWAKTNDIKPRWLIAPRHVRGTGHMSHAPAAASPSPSPVN